MTSEADSAASLPHRSGSWWNPLTQIGMRARIVLSFAMLATLISVLLIVSSVVVSRRHLLEQREALAAHRARINAVAVTDKVGLPDTDAQALFGSLTTTGRPSLILRSGVNKADQSISFDDAYGAGAVPRSLVNWVIDDRGAAMMRFTRRGEPLLAVGVPLTDRRGGYFEITTLSDIESTIRSLSRVLTFAAVATTLLGAGLGWWASRRVLRPLADISRLSEDIAAGRLDARLAYSEWADDIDLAPLVSSFNGMVTALQGRIDRDARFASDVSHELRSPLTTFNASIQVLQNARAEMPERAVVALDLLTSDMERFTQLVEDLLEISRFDAGAVRLELDEVLITDTVELAVRTLSSEPIPVECDPSLSDLIALCDKRRLVRVLANFIDNATKYGSGVERVSVERVSGEGGSDDADAGDENVVGDRVRIAVEDRGAGVPVSERDRIFDRFHRGDQGGSRGSDLGVGLGLALAAEHASLQGGSVWVEDRPDGEPGARFVLELPLLEPPEASSVGVDGTDGVDGGRDDTVVEAEASDAADVVRTGEHRRITIDRIERVHQDLAQDIAAGARATGPATEDEASG